MILRHVGPGESIQAVIDGLPDDGQQAVVELAPGVYREKLVIARPHTELRGSGRDDTVIAWDDGAFEILEDGMKRGTFRTATVRTDAAYVSIRHLTIRNDASPRERVGQAIALYADGEWFILEDCSLVSFQDTLFTAPLPPKEVEKNGFIGPKQFAPRVPQHQVYRNCRIAGDVDFIFGGATAWFEECEIVSVDGRSDRSQPYVGYCTAASTPEGQDLGYVFHDCRFLGEGVPDGSVYLGRPWRSFARTYMIDCTFGKHIHPTAFHDWGKKDFHQTGLYALANCRFEGPTGPWMADVRELSTDEVKACALPNHLPFSLPDP